MSLARFSFVPLGPHELHVTEWGRRDKPALVMWHGLARTGRDFDELAAALSDDYFVLCPDTIGRGLSSWSPDPKADYSLDCYARLAVGLLDHFAIDRAGWIGTSMGGLIGMLLAASAAPERLEYLVINDIGPEIPQAAIDRILAYADTQPVFGNMREAEAWFRAAYAPFGDNSAAFWTRMARSSVRRLADGRLTTHYDPKITVQFEQPIDSQAAWQLYQDIRLPTHVIQGAQSDILPNSILERMKAEGPKPGVSIKADCGHAPTLASQEDAQQVRNLLAQLGK